ncbi:unnamed protein product [Bursaphelenchus xylophilus]|uniref:(pine wood nematode) hypothetical protein n=1 Tax=Bursaphelenchus xylophilus TaxID=6326 RepID=A0A1I7RHG4_BURXY|nr:unnamed protein product [Bursaphelenchus xylophilus]CAG9115774.1 unnamed protein product [Bursaphelenchus xylophilus]
MAPSRCAHEISQNKKLERIQKLISFIKAAGRQQHTAKLTEVWAIPQCSITDVRILFVVGADPSALYENEYGEKVLADRMENGSICSLCGKKYREFLQFARQIHQAQYGKIPLKIKKPTKPIGQEHGLVTVALDGGGMRGLVSIVCMLFTSRRILGDESFPNLVDWWVGCSTGSMLALALAKGNSLIDTFFLYWEMKNEIFLDKSTMKRLFGNVIDKQSVRVDNVLNRVFDNENDTFLNSPLRLTVPALDITTTPGRLHVFRNYPTKGNMIEDVHFKDAARASSAAPTYFHPHTMGARKLVDGSLVANCPLGILFGEYDKCLQTGDKLKLGCVISIGTGEPAETKRRYKSGSSLSHRSRHLRDMAVLLIEQVVGYERSVVDCAKDRCLAAGIPFFRICPVGIDVKIDQINDGVLMDMIWETLLHLLRNCEQVDELGQSLAKLCNSPSNPTPRRARRGHSVEPPMRLC